MTATLAARLPGVVGEVAYALRLPPELKATLEAWAREERRSLNAQIVHLLEQAVREQRRERGSA